MTAVIDARELRKRFPGGRDQTIEAVRGVSLQVTRGEIVGFLGPNGAGKTTTLRMLTTLLPIDGGSATVAGLDVRRQPGRVRGRIGYVSQLGGADELATGRENLILQGRLYGRSRAEVARRVGEVLDEFDLAGFADRRVRTYSGGQRRRLDVALGVVHEPEVLFLDEPSTGLDPQNRASLWDHVRGLRDGGTTVFLTTHYLDEADVLCDRIMIIDHGMVVAEGTPRALKQQVAGDAIVLVTRDADAAARAAAELAGQPAVRDLTLEGDAVRLYASDGPAALPGLLRLLDQAGLAVRSLRLSEPSLDDVFLRQTGRSLRDAGPPAAGPPTTGPVTTGPRGRRTTRPRGRRHEASDRHRPALPPPPDPAAAQPGLAGGRLLHADPVPRPVHPAAQAPGRRRPACPPGTSSTSSCRASWPCSPSPAAAVPASARSSSCGPGSPSGSGSPRPAGSPSWPAPSWPPCC